MTARAKNLAKVAVFGGFIIFSILVGTSWTLDPPAPTRVGDDPYAVSLKQLSDYHVQLEGQPIVITNGVSDVIVNATSGDMQFTISYAFLNISEQVLFKAWAPGGVQPAGSAIGNGTYLVIKGICKILSEGIIEGTEIHVLYPDNVYIVSVSGLVVIIVMLFVFFRLDIKRLRFQAKMKIKPGKETKSGGA
jgi:hypothetical protein